MLGQARPWAPQSKTHRQRTRSARAVPEHTAVPKHKENRGRTRRQRDTPPPKELPHEVRPFWMRVMRVLERMRSVVEGVAAVGEPLLTGGVGGRGVRGTDLPLSPCDRGHRRAWETRWEAGRDRRGPGQRSYPCAVRGTRVYPNALACFAIVFTLRSWYCAS